MRKIFLIILAVGALGRAAHVITDGFIVSHINAELDPGPEIVFDPSIYSKKFTYLGSGSQSFAFVSDDGEYVLKFFKEHRWRGHNARKVEGRRATYASLREAYTYLREKTGMVALHLEKTRSLGQVTIYDKNHIGHAIDLNTVAFVLQKKAIPLGDYLKSVSYEEGRSMIDEMMTFMKERFACGLRDKDPHPINNFGVLNRHIVDFDIGGFARDPSKGLRYFYQEELETVKNKFLPWLKQHAPDLVDYTKKTIEEMQETR